MTLIALSKKIQPVLKNRGVVKAALFGSYAKGGFSRNSDIDILVKLKSDKTLLDLVALKHDLEDKLGKKVDVITYNSLNPLLKDGILRDQKVIYEKKS